MLLFWHGICINKEEALSLKWTVITFVASGVP